LTFSINIVFSTQIHSIVWMTSNHHQVALFRWRATLCWLWFCTRCDNPFLVSCCFRNVGVHVTFDVSRPPPIHFSTKDTQGKFPESVMSWNPCRVKFQWRCSSEDKYTPILLQVWKSLEKSVQDVRDIPPFPIFCTLLALLMASWEKKFLPSKNPSLEDGVNYGVTRGLRTG
jgi:hypothetical protein